MWLWLICIFQVAFADEILRIAVLEFQTVQTMDPNFILQLSDETRGGALDVFPPSTSKVSVLTRENLMDVLTQQGKDASCMEGNCAVGIGRNIGARFVVVGKVAQVEGVYRLTLGVYDSDSNDLLGQKSIQETSQVKLLGEVRPFAEGLIEQTLGGFDEGRLGVRKIGGEPDTWTVSGSTQGVLEIAEPRLKGAKISVNGREVCDMRDKATCRALVDQGDVTVSIERQYCDVLTETVTVGQFSTLEPEMVCRFAVWNPPKKWKGLTVKVNDKPIGIGDEIPFGKITIAVEDDCHADLIEQELSTDGLSYSLSLRPKQRSVSISLLDSQGKDIGADVVVDRKSFGKTPVQTEVPLCTKSILLQKGPYEKGLTLTNKDTYTLYATVPVVVQRGWTKLEIDGKNIRSLTDVGFGEHEIYVETKRNKAQQTIQVDEHGLNFDPQWVERSRRRQLSFDYEPEPWKGWTAYSMMGLSAGLYSTSFLSHRQFDSAPSKSLYMLNHGAYYGSVATMFIGMVFYSSQWVHFGWEEY